MVEVNVAVTLGLACERALFGGAANEFDFGGSLVRNARFGDFDFWRKSRTKRLFCRLEA